VTDASVLLAVCGPRLALRLGQRAPGPRLSVDGVDFVEVRDGDFAGFYDWLRTVDGRVIGVRWWLFEELRRLCDRLQGRDYALVDPACRFVDLWFSTERAFDPGQSNDQDFGNNRVLESDNGDLLLSFNLDRVGSAIIGDGAAILWTAGRKGV